ncbi:hypothetical protein EDC44_1533 [Cricetibacter osteomyelitidis]|uniref:Uncharacterized protein n=1 Tax=Cricetibacter osteomyelitidis TaxID=1521931 RepID=A0A4R2SHZ7_9PAST|nr:hypothetical protein [Cricetibacter osteomyelitidis]TCP88650.1 hypothetical protein EDC44_1533 [Cricetibacter osteomyelitidis]
MNKIIVVLSGFFICNSVNAEKICNPESIQTNEIENCIVITNEKIENEIRKLISDRIYVLNNSEICQDRFSEVYPGKEANIEKLLCIQELLTKEKNELQIKFGKETREGMIVSEKVFLYEIPNQITKIYLVRGNKVTILKEKLDEFNQKWYFINYKGKKNINMWIKAEDVDLKEK